MGIFIMFTVSILLLMLLTVMGIYDLVLNREYLTTGEYIITSILYIMVTLLFIGISFHMYHYYYLR